MGIADFCVSCYNEITKIGQSSFQITHISGIRRIQWKENSHLRKRSSERNLYGRSVRLDVLCTLGNGKKCSEFMECFLEKEVNNPKFPKLTDRMYYLKHQRGGLNAMCDVMEKYERKAVGEANVRAIKYMITTFNASKEQILGKYSEEEYNLALRELEEESVHV